MMNRVSCVVKGAWRSLCGTGVSPVRALAIIVAVSCGSAWAAEYAIPEGDANALVRCLNSEDLKDGDVVRLAGGTYSRADVTEASLDANYFFQITKAITLVGTDDASETILDCGGRGGFLLNNEGATVAGVKLEKFITSAQLRALYVPAGVVSNVLVIGTGGAIMHSSVEQFTFGSAAVVTDCEFANFNNWNGGGAWDAKTMFAFTGATVRRTSFVDLVSYNSFSSVSGTARTRFESCVFTNCSNINRSVFPVSNAEFSDCTFGGCCAAKGGIFALSGEVTFSRCKFLSSTYNTGYASDQHPIFALAASASAYMTNCLVANNTRVGASVLTVAAGSKAHICNSTIVNNKSTKANPAFASTATAASPAEISMVNTILRYNTDSSKAERNVVMPLANTTVSCTNCAIDFTPDAGEGNVPDEEAFADAANLDYRLAKASPLIDAGADVPGLVDDLAGAVRPVDGSGSGVAAYDIGCYEAEELEIALECKLTALGAGGVYPCAVTQTVAVIGTRRTGLGYRWLAIRDLDGVLTTNEQVTAIAENVFENLDPGSYSFAVIVSNDRGDTAVDETDGPAALIRVDTCYVSNEGSDTWPYTNATIAARQFKDAFAIASRRIVIAPGAYSFEPTVDASGRSFVGMIGEGLEVVGAEDPADLVINCGGKGGFLLNGKGASVSGLTLTNLIYKAASYALNITEGVVSNVVVDGHFINTPSPSPNYNVVYVGEKGLLTDSRILNINKPNSTSATHVNVSGGTVRRTTFFNLKGQCTLVGAAISGTARPRFEDCVFENCTGMNSGAMSASDTDVVGCVFRGNKTQGTGDVYGGIALSKACTMVDCVVTNNDNASGGIPMIAIDSGSSAAASLAITNCLIARNRQKTGAVIRFKSGGKDVKLDLCNTTVAANTLSTANCVAGLAGWGSSGGRAQVSLVNTVVWGNTSGGVAKDFAASYSYTDFSAVNSCFTGFEPAEHSGLVTGDPMFVDAAAGDLRLGRGSSCIDTGCDMPAVATDLDGKERPLDGDGDGIASWDIGCYEADTLEIPLECKLKTFGAGGIYPCAVTQAVTVVGTRLTGLSYRWLAIRDMGGVLTTNEQVTSVAENVFENLEPGSYSFAVIVSNDRGDTAADATDGPVATILFDTCYVSNEGSNTWPYTNETTAARQFKDAAALAGRRIVVAPGAYSFEPCDDPSGKKIIGVVGAGVEVVGAADPVDLVIDCGGMGGFRLGGKGASICGMTLTNFMAQTGSGDALRLVGGTASNMVLQCTCGDVVPGVCLYVGEQALATDVKVRDFKCPTKVSDSQMKRGVYVYGGTLRRCVYERGVQYRSDAITAVQSSGGYSPRLEDCDILNCKTTYSTVLNGQYTSVTGCRFIGNRYANAASVLVSFRWTDFSNCVFTCNSGTDVLVPVWTSGYKYKITSCLIACNTNTTGCALNLSGDGEDVLLTNCTIADNRTTGGATAGISGNGANNKLTVRNCIVKGNIGNNGEKDIASSASTKMTQVVSTSCFAEAEDYPDQGNTALDPKFRKGRFHWDGGHAYMLRGTSPCIDTGALLNWTDADKDLAGNPRILRDEVTGKGYVDMGCYECPKAGGLLLMVR